MRFEAHRRHRTASLGMEVLEQRRLLAGLPELVALSEASSLYAPLADIPASREGAASYLAPSSAVPFALNTADLRATLARAPMEFTNAGFTNPLQLSIPTPDGSLARFEIVEAPVMHPELAAKFPEIKTYRGQGIDSPADTIRFDVTPQGFHAQVLGPDGAYYIDPYYHLDDSVYVSYHRSDFDVSDEVTQLRASDREIGIVEDDLLITDNGSYRLEEDGSLTTVEGGERFEIHTPGNYSIDADGMLTLGSGAEQVVYAEAAYHLHNDGTVHVRVSADPEIGGGGCPGCGGLGCPSCGPADAAHEAHGTVDVSASIEALPVTEEAKGGKEDGGDEGLGRRTGETLRTYRLANAATVEYTNFHGGSVSSGLSAIVTAINRVTGIYEVELTIRMELVPNNDQLVFTNATGDSYSNNNTFAMLNQNQSVIDSTIGNANYDIGHVFGTSGGGVAGLGVVGITGQKARGVSSLGVPVGDPFSVDYVAHEMGHQYGGSHTFNGDSSSCSGNRTGSSAYEPGSGSTIQAYAGICGNDNLQSNSDPYFHSRSLDQMLSHVDNIVPNAGTRTNTGNSEPVADAGPNYEIPAGTPFMLTGSGTDPNGDLLTYNWEQRDLGPQSDLNAADDGQIPLFRSRLATESPTRFFPREQNLVAGNYSQGGEKLPTVNRRMDFRLTVRDNASGGGGVDTDNMWVDINNTGSPFQVTSQDSGTAWLGGDMETITWDVAGTTNAPINTSNVDIFLSDDGGFTYDIVLATGVPNNGSYTFAVPGDLEIAEARLMVKGAGNIFFDINDTSFPIIGTDTTPPTANATTNDINGQGFTSLFFSVTYMDNQAVDASDIGPGDLEIVAPDNSILPVNYVSRSSDVDVPTIIGNYRVFAPNGTWQVADNGMYTVRLLAGEVTDVEENAILSDTNIGTFNVNVPVPEGDFNGDGALDCADIDLLTSTIADGINDPALDVTGEGVLNYSDVVEWVENLKGTLIGDANLDFVVDGQDFLVWNNNKFSSGTAWCSGDFNADGNTDGSDFIFWNNNKFQNADQAIVAPVRTAKQTQALTNDDIEVIAAAPRLRAAAPAIRVSSIEASAIVVRATQVVEEPEEEARWTSDIDRLFATV